MRHFFAPSQVSAPRTPTHRGLRSSALAIFWLAAPLTAVLLLSTLLLGACGSSQRSDGGQGLLEVGATAPDFAAQDQSGEVRTFSQMRGRAPTVLFFYPRDGTPGCTEEACAFRDAWTRLQGASALVVGVSTDSVADHAAFAAEHDLPFTLLADPEGAIARHYGVSTTFGMAARVTFLIGRDGQIARVFPDVDPSLHVDEIISALEALPQN